MSSITSVIVMGNAEKKNSLYFHNVFIISIRQWQGLTEIISASRMMAAVTLRLSNTHTELHDDVSL